MAGICYRINSCQPAVYLCSVILEYDYEFNGSTDIITRAIELALVYTCN